MSAAEYRSLFGDATNLRRVRLPESVGHMWPTMALGLPADDSRLSEPVVGDERWGMPLARAISGTLGEVILLVGGSSRPGEVSAESRSSLMVMWTPEQARVVAGQLMMAARAAEMHRVGESK